MELGEKMRLVLATNNKNKIREIKYKFREIKDLDLVSLSDFEDPPEVVEDRLTFEENAIKKAREISKFTGLPVLSDDSGLVVDALDGRPGVLSARYAGENATDMDRNLKLLDEMKEIDNNRDAKFVCAIAIVLPDNSNYLAIGECQGEIIHTMRGHQGFGYDPIFLLPDYKKTMAELTLDEKNSISHRARALDKAAGILEQIIADHG